MISKRFNIAVPHRNVRYTFRYGLVSQLKTPHCRVYTRRELNLEKMYLRTLSFTSVFHVCSLHFQVRKPDSEHTQGRGDYSDHEYRWGGGGGGMTTATCLQMTFRPVTLPSKKKREGEENTRVFHSYAHENREEFGGILPTSSSIVKR